MLVLFILNSTAYTASFAASAVTGSRPQRGDFLLRWVGSGRVAQKPCQIGKRVDKNFGLKDMSSFCHSDLIDKLFRRVID